MYLLLALAASYLFSVGGLFMKWSEGFTRLGPSLALFACFLAGAACQTVAMRRSDMGAVYLFVLGLESVITFLLSAFLLHEHWSATRVCAVLLIVAGLALLHRS